MASQDTLQGSGAMFDRIADHYDLLNRLMSLGFDRLWRKRMAQAIVHSDPKPQKILDLAAGTGDVVLALHAAGSHADFTLLDPSIEMLKLAEPKLEQAKLAHRSRILEGDAQQLPFAADSFDAVTMAFGIRNVPDRAKALREIKRVTRQGGIVAILELGTPRGLLSYAADLHVRFGLPLIGRLFRRPQEYTYLQESMHRFPAPQAFVAQCTEAGLVSVQIQAMMFGAVHLYLFTA